MKLDISKIEGYADMTPEQKLAALEGYEIPDPDYSGFVSKETFDRTASELAAKKKELAAKMTEDEKQKQAEQEAREELEKKYNKLLHESVVSKNKAELLGLGYEDKLASDTAEAMAKGDLKTVFENQRKHLDTFEKQIRAEALKGTPKPIGDGDGGKTMTISDFRKLSVAERYKFQSEHPDEYKELYDNQGGNE